VAAAIHTLLAPGGDGAQQAQRSQANAWLNSFSGTRGAWQVALTLLAHQQSEVRPRVAGRARRLRQPLRRGMRWEPEGWRRAHLARALRSQPAAARRRGCQLERLSARCPAGRIRRVRRRRLRTLRRACC
jgi:hypothetical protein